MVFEFAQQGSHRVLSDIEKPVYRRIFMFDRALSLANIVKTEPIKL